MLRSRHHYYGVVRNTACFYREFGCLPIRNLQDERRIFFFFCNAPSANSQCDYDNVRKEVNPAPGVFSQRAVCQVCGTVRRATVGFMYNWDTITSAGLTLLSFKGNFNGSCFCCYYQSGCQFFHVISSLAPRFCVLEKFRSEEKTGMTVSARILGVTTNVVEWHCALRHSKSWSLGQGLWIKVERVLLKLLHCICVSVWGDEKRGSGDWEKCVEMDGAVAHCFPSSRGTITYSLL